MGKDARSTIHLYILKNLARVRYETKILNSNLFFTLNKATFSQKLKLFKCFLQKHKHIFFLLVKT